MEQTRIGINTVNPQFSLDVTGDVHFTQNMYVRGHIEIPTIQIENIAEWVGTVYLENNTWKVSTIYKTRISPSSVTLVSTGVFRISFIGDNLPLKESESGSVLSVGSRKYLIMGSSSQGTSITNRNVSWQTNSIEYSVRGISTNDSFNTSARLYVKILL